MVQYTQELLTYPLPAERWPALLTFWQTEWNHTDVDWLEALRGAYADSLAIRLAVAYSDGRIVGTASAYYPRGGAEICCCADVLTLQDMRGHGIAANLTDTVVKSAFGAGCRVAYLGNANKPRSVYEKIGFQRIRGAVMRRGAPGEADPEAGWYAAGQPLSVRDTVWADLPGVACLLAQPLSICVADYPRGLVSAKYADPPRCVSNFTTVWYEVANRGGKMLTLAGASPYRVLGFGTLTPEPGPARGHRAVVEVVAHDNHEQGIELLIEGLMAEARRRNYRAVHAYVVESDQSKARYLRKAGFSSVAELPAQVRLGGRSLGVSLFSIVAALS